MWSAEGYRYAKAKKDAMRTLQKVKSEYPTLQTGYTRRSLLKKYRSIDKEERIKRKTLQMLSQLAFRGIEIERIDLDSKGYEAVFVAKNISAEKKLRSLAKQHGMTVQAENGKMSVKGVW
jgi:hypothetical protein